jgi:hypothetical protein
MFKEDESIDCGVYYNKRKAAGNVVFQVGWVDGLVDSVVWIDTERIEVGLWNILYQYTYGRFAAFE